MQVWGRGWRRGLGQGRHSADPCRAVTFTPRAQVRSEALSGPRREKRSMGKGGADPGTAHSLLFFPNHSRVAPGPNPMSQSGRGR